MGGNARSSSVASLRARRPWVRPEATRTTLTAHARRHLADRLPRPVLGAQQPGHEPVAGSGRRPPARRFIAVDGSVLRGASPRIRGDDVSGLASRLRSKGMDARVRQALIEAGVDGAQLAEID